MDKQKQIEEMIEVVANWAYRNGMLWHEGYAKLLAETLIENDCKKIPENTVVLTDEKDIKQFEWSKMLDKMGFFKFADNLRKDTAKEIFADLFANVYEYDDTIHFECLSKPTLKKIAKRYGVGGDNEK